jgi:DNA-binding helix-hairpin-helix protein with protein kinase domain
MNQLLKLGQTLQTLTPGGGCTVDAFLGGGAQGEVYQALLGEQAVALKWYFSHHLQQNGGLRQRLERAIAACAPSDRFLWPMEIVLDAAQPDHFGYLMPLREARFKGLVDLVTRRVSPSLRALVTTGFELAYNYFALHQKGLCYRDIAFGNVFFDPTTGEVRICDNDNVDVNNEPGAIAGTPRFMAPEIVRGEAQPTTQTDLHSLAVLLFYLLCNHHPLEGKRELAIHCFDQPAMTRLYGKEALFIFDPNDEGNRPLPGEQDNPIAFWAIYPSQLRLLFTRAFTDGIRNPNGGRVRETEWCNTLLQVRDGIFYCLHCSAENFYDDQALRQQKSLLCWSCGRTLNLPPRLRIQHDSERMIVMLNHDSKLYPHHIDSTHRYQFDHPVAAVTRHPTNPTRWGLQNLTEAPWVVTGSDGVVREVPPERSISLAEGARIHFGPSQGEVRL